MNGNLLKSKRILLGITQKDLAKKLSVSEKTYNHKEQGKIHFKPGEIVKISKELSLSNKEVNQIFFDSNLPYE